jgi:hypothetical protein
MLHKNYIEWVRYITQASPSRSSVQKFIDLMHGELLTTELLRLESLLRAIPHSDCRLKICDTYFPGHRLILGLGSPTLQALFVFRQSQKKATSRKRKRNLWLGAMDTVDCDVLCKLSGDEMSAAILARLLQSMYTHALGQTMPFSTPSCVCDNEDGANPWKPFLFGRVLQVADILQSNDAIFSVFRAARLQLQQFQTSLEAYDSKRNRLVELLGGIAAENDALLQRIMADSISTAEQVASVRAAHLSLNEEAREASKQYWAEWRGLFGRTYAVLASDPTEKIYPFHSPALVAMTETRDTFITELQFRVLSTWLSTYNRWPRGGALKRFFRDMKYLLGKNPVPPDMLLGFCHLLQSQSLDDQQQFLDQERDFLTFMAAHMPWLHFVPIVVPLVMHSGVKVPIDTWCQALDI